MKNRTKQIIAIVFFFVMTACQLSTQVPPPSTETPSPSNTSTHTLTITASPTPTFTQTPTTTPTITSSPTITPTPTLTPVIQSAPVDVDVSEPPHANRPQLSGFVRYVDTDHFRIFYTMSGEDALQVDDINGNAVPDYVEVVAKALEHSWDVEIDQLGWAPPPPDNNQGGDERYDVYLEDLDMYIAGYVNDGDASSNIGDNPRTESTELTASYSYMGLDNDFAEVEGLDHITLSGLDFMRTTVAHEFNHAIQFGYGNDEPHRWLWEASATWVETYVYEEIKDADTHIKPAFKSPDTCLLDYGGYDRVESAGHWYALWVFLRYISETLEATILRDIWEETILLDGYNAFETAFTSYGTTFDEMYQAYTIALLLRNFEYELDYPTVRLEGLVEGIQSWAPKDGVGQMAADFVEIDTEGIVEISLWNLDHGIVVGIRDQEADIFHLDDAKITINADDYEKIYLIVHNLDRAEVMDDCRIAQYRVRVLKGEIANTPDETLPADNFKTPSVEPLIDPHAPKD